MAARTVLASAGRGRSLLAGNILRQKLASGRYSDGGGLYLLVRDKARSWLFFYRASGKRREMGLGPAGDVSGCVSLVEARRRADEARALVAEGYDPLDHRKEMERRADEARMLAESKTRMGQTFGEIADAYIEGQASGFKNSKHIAQWKMTLGAAYCAGIRDKPIGDIGTEQVLAILQPIWLEKNETASRIRGRIERVLDAAKAKGLRDGENPARWRGHLDHLLPKRQKLQRGHHAAMPYAALPAFVLR